MSIVINPVGMTFEEWSDRMNLELEPIRPAMKFLPGDDWREWAAQLIDSADSAIQTQNNADPYQYDNWQDWAERLEMVRT